jgi:hypothetical protein
MATELSLPPTFQTVAHPARFRNDLNVTQRLNDLNDLNVSNSSGLHHIKVHVDELCIFEFAEDVQLPLR